MSDGGSFTTGFGDDGFGEDWIEPTHSFTVVEKSEARALRKFVQEDPLAAEDLVASLYVFLPFSVGSVDHISWFIFSRSLI